MFGLRSFARLKRDPDVERLLSLPAVKSGLAQLEAETVEQRKDLARELQAINAGKHRKAGEEALRRSLEAEKRLLAAKEAYMAACKEHAVAVNELIGVSFVEGSERKRIEAALLESADPRINAFAACLDVLRHSQVNNASLVWPTGKYETDHESDPMRKYRKYDSNVGDVAKARELLKQAMDDAAAMRFEALTAEQVTTRLQAWCTKLAEPLDKVGFKPPVVTGVDVEPGQSWWPASEHGAPVVSQTV